MQAPRVPYAIITILLCIAGVTGLVLFNPLSCPSQVTPPPCPDCPTLTPMTAPATRAPPVREIPGAALALARRNWEADRAGKEHGVANLQHLLGLLAEIEPVGGRHRVVIDIGGNVGQTTSRLMHEIVRKKSSGHFHMYTFEPMTAYDTIVARARAENWTAHRYTVFQCAVGLKPGTAKFYFDNDTSEQSSQDSSAAGTAKFTRQVPIINMDQFFYEGVSRDIVRWGTPRNTTNDSYGSHDIFFYKMDTEGYDMDVLDGSHRLLTEKRARFIEFEYNGKWFSLGRTRTLKQVTRDLYERYDYECYFISEKYLHPLFGVWWHSDMEIREWSNVFCGLRHDHLLHWIVRRFDHQDFGALSPIDTIEFSALTGNP